MEEVEFLEITVAGVQQLTNVTDMQRILQETIAQEKLLEKSLQGSLETGKSQVEAKLEILEVLPAKLRPVFAHVRDLAAKVDETCVLAENVSRKVKILDVTRHRVQQTTKRVHDILEVKNCIEGIDMAMESENWEKACELFKSYLSIVSQEESQREDKKRLQVLDENSSALLQKKLEELRGIIRKKAEQAIYEADVKRFCKLFTPLGIPGEGLKKYTAFVRSVLKHELDDLYQVLQKSIAGKLPEAEQLTCVECATMMYESVANITQTQLPLVLEAFGEESVIPLLKGLQQQCDIHAPKVLDRFKDLYRVPETIKDISPKQNPNPRFSSSVEQSKVDPAELELIVEGITSLSQRTELYYRFIQKQVISHVPVNQRPNRILPESVLDRSMSELLDQYLILEKFYMQENVRKAILLDVQQRANSTQSSLVDYAFFIFRRCVNRSLFSYNQQSVSVVLNMVHQVLTQQLKDELVKLLDSRVSAQASVRPELISGALNNFYQTSENINTLKAETEAEIFRIFQVDQSRQQVLMCLESFSEASNEFKSILSKYLEQLSSSLEPSMAAMIKRLKSISYDLNEIKFAENEINDPFAEDFIEELRKMFSKYKTNLVEDNFDSLVLVCVRHLNKLIESAIMQMNFSQLGALQFDKDLRKIISYFTSITNRSVRGEFARLIQIASLLNLEKVSEVLDYWGENSGQMTWRLAPSEVRRVLSRRTDFPAEQIAALKLQ